jgi:hypothetical protein
MHGRTGEYEPILEFELQLAQTSVPIKVITDGKFQNYAFIITINKELCAFETVFIKSMIPSFEA